MKNVVKIVLLASVITTVISALFLYGYSLKKSQSRHIVVGFLYNGDESTPYTQNFMRAEDAVRTRFGDSVDVIVKNNVPDDSAEEAIEELARNCDILFASSYGYQSTMKTYAAKYPDKQFVQATGDNGNGEPLLDNYHTFMGHIYEGRYISGVVAGLKMKELIDAGEITPEQVKIGYVGAFEYAEVISGYTAFFLGVRSIVPEATMSVKYVNTWSSYTLEKEAAEELIEAGCLIISQHSDTIGPAVACEESLNPHVYHVGYNQSMLDIAPTKSLVSCRINYTKYIEAAVEAVLDEKPIEKKVKGRINRNDIGAGFDEDWVQMLQTNSIIVAEGTDEVIASQIENFKKHKIEVFKGDYIGVNPFDPSDIFDLSQGYQENAGASAPSFHYVLQGVIEVIE